MRTLRLVCGSCCGSAGPGTYVPSFPTLLAMGNLPEVRARNPQRPHPSWLLYLSGTHSRPCHSALLHFLHVTNSGWAYPVYLFVCLFTARALVQSRCSINISQMELMNERCTRRKTLVESSHWKHGGQDRTIPEGWCWGILRPDFLSFCFPCWISRTFGDTC